MKQLLGIAVGVLAFVASAVGMASASAAPGPNGLNDHGLCTAYFNGQKVGHGPGEDTDDPPPFQGLEDAGEAYTQTDEDDNDRDTTPDDSDESAQLTDAENIFNFCNDGGLIGGNPERGRFTCNDPGVADDDTSDSESDPECSRNEKPGKN
jgi:hypothetical protein